MSNRKLLLADDSITIQKVVNLTFAEEGIDVITVGDGDSALARISEEWPDLVLADVNMPGASGYQICESIRSNAATEDIPVILLVGSFEPFDEAEATRVGANAYLTKPFHSIRQLVAQVTELIETRRQPGDEVRDPVEELAAAPVEQLAPDDIEDLYDQSMTPQAEVPGEIGSFDISDQGLDDEMIETSYTKDADTLEFSLVEPNLERSVSEMPTEEFSTLEVETPYSQPEPQMVDLESFQEEAAEVADDRVEPSSESLFDEGSQTLRQESFEDLSDASWNAENQDVVMSEAEAVQEMHTESVPFVSDAEPEQPPAFEPSEEEFASIDVPSIESPSEEVSSYTPWNDESENIHGTPEQTIAASVPTRVFEEIDLLELPPVGEESAIELTTVELADEQSSSKQIVSLSPELIDTIVQKVIDRMSERS